MAEVLVVMAIIMVLSGIAVPNAMRVMNNVRQMSLNRSAETIYMTAQRNLIAAKVAGKTWNTGLWTYDSNYTSSDAVPPLTGYYYMVTSADSRVFTDSGHSNYGQYDENAAINTILPANTISPTLLNQKWWIKYDDASGQIIEVYYSELKGANASEDASLLAQLKTIYDSGELGKVGYYG